MRTMSLSLYGIPDGQQKGQSKVPCPSVYAPASALRSLSSVALSSAPGSKTLSRSSTVRAIPPHFSQTISSTFLFEAMNPISSTFLREATGALWPLRISAALCVKNYFDAETERYAKAAGISFAVFVTVVLLWQYSAREPILFYRYVTNYSFTCSVCGDALRTADHATTNAETT